MALISDDILWRVSLALLDPVVNTTSSTSLSAGSHTATVGSTVAMYVGAILIWDRGGVNEELVTITAVPSPTTVTATFTNNHSGSQVVVAATFPSGHDTAKPLFTQGEMLNYLAQAQNDFLLGLRPVYKRSTQTLNASTSTFSQPSDCIRMERLSIAGAQIPDSSQAYIDLTNPNWPGATTAASPSNWFQDKVDTGNFGIRPQLAFPVIGAVYYSQKGATSLALNTALVLPDIFSQYLKYGVLARAFAKDGEQRDPDRASYCYRRVSAGIEASKRFLEGAKVEVPA